MNFLEAIKRYIKGSGVLVIHKEHIKGSGVLIIHKEYIKGSGVLNWLNDL